MKHIAIVLSAGKGKRMGSAIPKQYLTVGKKPIINYTLDTFEQSFMDEIIVVVAPGDEDTFARQILPLGNYRKVTRIVAGGKERYDSVYAGLCAIAKEDQDAYVYIHDGARACIRPNVLEAGRDAALQYGNAVAGMPVKDTIKIVDETLTVVDTPDRKNLWLIQTPQIFKVSSIRLAYEAMYQQDEELRKKVTDDAMVMETFGQEAVHIFEASYENIKITTPDDLEWMKRTM